MNKWELNEHKQLSEKVRSQRFCPPLLNKNRNYEGIWSNKRKSFVKPVGMNSSNFKNETLFVSFMAIITTRNGSDGTNFFIRNRVVNSIKKSRNRLVNMIVPYGTKVLYLFSVSFWRRANARNVRLYYPYWQYTDLFIFRFVSLLCLRSTLRLL